MIIGIRHIPSSLKRAVEIVGEHNLLHDLSYHCELDTSEKASTDGSYQNQFTSQPSPVEKSDIKEEIVNRHKRTHEYLLEYPEHADDFMDGSLDNTLDPSLKAAYMMAKAKARRIENDERDAEEMMGKGSAILSKLIAFHKGVPEKDDEGT